MPQIKIRTCFKESKDKNILSSQRIIIAMTEAQAKKRIEELSKKIDEHNYKYYVLSNPSISDYDFDMMLEELIKLENYFRSLQALIRLRNVLGG